MNHKICFLFLVILQAGCAMELRDRHQQEEVPLPEPTEFTELKEFKIENEYTLPIPLVPSAQTTLRFDRLVLGPKAQLITQGLNIRIEVKELIAHDATIRTFKSDQIAAQGFNGRSGGHLELIAEHATGKLSIVLQGEKGGTGATGAAPNETLRGARGATGLNAGFITTERGAVFNVRRAENGSPGAQGLPGFQGGNGFKGGDSGTALIKTSLAEDFILNIQKNPGSGGEGGLGGAGGLGGLGGDPGSEAFPAYNGPPLHNYAASGPTGSQGPQGPKGNPGMAGFKEKSCIQENSEALYCE